MPIDVGWLYEGRVIKIHQHGKITSGQIVTSAERSAELIRQGQAPVHVILNGQDTEGTPDIALGDLRKLIPTVVEGSGLMVIIQSRVMDRFFASLSMQIAGVRYKFATDEDAALELLLEYDPTLNGVIR
jgi:hypothetical protein